MSFLSESKIIAEKFIQNQTWTHYLSPQLPFRLFRNPSIFQEFSNPKISLPLNRFTDPLSFTGVKSHISIWSQNHLQFLKEIASTQKFIIEKTLLKNPFKTQRLIQLSIEAGLKNMVVDTFQELWKIHECRCMVKKQSEQYPNLNFIWSITDPYTDLKQIQTLKTYNIRLGGLLINQQFSDNISLVKDLVESINKESSQKKKMKSLFLQASSNNFQRNLKKYENDPYFSKNKIEIIHEKADFKMNSSYFIVAKVIGQNKRKDLIVSDQAYDYLSFDQIKKGKIIEEGNKRWILSQISYFPMKEIMEEHTRKGYIMNLHQFMEV